MRKGRGQFYGAENPASFLHYFALTGPKSTPEYLSKPSYHAEKYTGHRSGDRLRVSCSAGTDSANQAKLSRVSPAPANAVDADSSPGESGLRTNETLLFVIESQKLKYSRAAAEFVVKIFRE